MTFLEAWVTTPLAQAVGWTLLHSLWEGAIVSATLASALMAVRSARARYAAACVALLVILGGVGFTLVRVMPQGSHGLRGAATYALPAWNAPADMDGSSRLAFADFVPWLAPFWIVGIWIFALGQVVGWISVSRLRRRGVCCAPERWQKEIVRLGEQLRLAQPVLLLESCLADVPMVVGHIRPVVLMPLGLLTGLPAGQIEAILLHELTHIRRYDYLVNVFQRSIETLLFYHPAVWWISRVIRTERENCCDDVVVATSGNAREYAVALATLEQTRCSDREPALAASGGSLVKRIRRLLYPKGANSFWTPVFGAIILIATGIVAMAARPQELPARGAAAVPPIVQLRPFPEEPLAHFRLSADSRRVFELLAGLAKLNVTFTSDFQSRRITVDLTNVKIEEALRLVCAETKTFWTAAAPSTILVMPDNLDNRRKYLDRGDASPYESWLNQEVAYIIGDNERTAFKKLTTNEEREKFVEQFWERRNPNPGSPRNQFREEYYRRVAYANDHFAFASSRPGWRTDRGRIYILYGPPDEIDSHPSGGSYKRPDSEGGGTTPTYPFEQWRYRHIDGIGNNVIMEFVDVSSSGEFRMTSDPKAKYKKR